MIDYNYTSYLLRAPNIFHANDCPGTSSRRYFSTTSFNNQPEPTSQFTSAPGHKPLLIPATPEQKALFAKAQDPNIAFSMEGIQWVPDVSDKTVSTANLPFAGKISDTKHLRSDFNASINITIQPGYLPKFTPNKLWAEDVMDNMKIKRRSEILQNRIAIGIVGSNPEDFINTDQTREYEQPAAKRAPSIAVIPGPDDDPEWVWETTQRAWLVGLKTKKAEGASYGNEYSTKWVKDELRVPVLNTKLRSLVTCTGEVFQVEQTGDTPLIFDTDGKYTFWDCGQIFSICFGGTKLNRPYSIRDEDTKTNYLALVDDRKKALVKLHKLGVTIEIMNQVAQFVYVYCGLGNGIEAGKLNWPSNLAKWNSKGHTATELYIDVEPLKLDEALRFEAVWNELHILILNADGRLPRPVRKIWQEWVDKPIPLAISLADAIGKFYLQAGSTPLIKFMDGSHKPRNLIRASRVFRGTVLAPYTKEVKKGSRSSRITQENMEICNMCMLKLHQAGVTETILGQMVKYVEACDSLGIHERYPEQGGAGGQSSGYERGELWKLSPEDYRRAHERKVGTSFEDLMLWEKMWVALIQLVFNTDNPNANPFPDESCTRATVSQNPLVTEPWSPLPDYHQLSGSARSKFTEEEQVRLKKVWLKAQQTTPLPLKGLDFDPVTPTPIHPFMAIWLTGRRFEKLSYDKRPSVGFLDSDRSEIDLPPVGNPSVEVALKEYWSFVIKKQPVLDLGWSKGELLIEDESGRHTISIWNEVIYVFQHALTGKDPFLHMPTHRLWAFPSTQRYTAWTQAILDSQSKQIILDLHNIGINVAVLKNLERYGEVCNYLNVYIGSLCPSSQWDYFAPVLSKEYPEWTKNPECIKPWLTVLEETFCAVITLVFNSLPPLPTIWTDKAPELARARRFDRFAADSENHGWAFVWKEHLKVEQLDYENLPGVNLRHYHNPGIDYKYRDQFNKIFDIGSVDHKYRKKCDYTSKAVAARKKELGFTEWRHHFFPFKR